jgi:Cu(I)/Ag(I) efflux system membrane fusion protein
MTAAVFTAVLWFQHGRSAWPFDRSPAPGAPDGTARMEDMAAAGGDAGHARASVEVSATQALDIRLETVGRESLTQTTRAVATIVPDESRISHVHTRVAGWVEQLDVNTTGESVQAGQSLARVFSQELLSSQIEYLSARRHAAASGITTAVVAGGRTRLAVLGMTAEEIESIEQSGQPKRLVSVVAPRSGIVVNRGVTVGTSVDPSTTLLTIADLSRVWVLAEVPEANIPHVRVGTWAELDFPASGRPPFGARVDFVYPTLTERTRTLRVRLSAANPGGVLRPGLYGTAAFESAGPPVIAVPRDAVVDTGLQQHVFVAVADRFEPRLVTLGAQLADRVEIRDGLEEGEQIVASGVFLLDSESRLRATGGAGGHNHGTTGSATPQAAPVRPAGPAIRKPRPASAVRPLPDPRASRGTGPVAPADPHSGHDVALPAAADSHAGHAGPAVPVVESHDGPGSPPAPPADPHAGHRE